MSGLASAWPDIVAGLVHDRDQAAHERVCELRDALAGLPFLSALKHVLIDRGVLTSADVRPPLRHLTQAERATLPALIA